MFSQDDDNQGLVLGVVFGLIALVIALVIGLSIWKTRVARVPAPAAIGVTVGTGVFAVGPAVVGSGATAPSALRVEPGLVKIYFYPGQTDLPVGATEALAVMAQEVVAGRTLELSSYHDASGNAGRNAELARLRAVNVRDLLASLGVPPAKMEMRKPVGLGDAGVTSGPEARRVEVVVR